MTNEINASSSSPPPKELSDREIAKQIEGLLTWMETPEAIAQKARLLNESEERSKLIEKSKIVDPEVLKVPFGPANGSNDWSSLTIPQA